MCNWVIAETNSNALKFAVINVGYSAVRGGIRPWHIVLCTTLLKASATSISSSRPRKSEATQLKVKMLHKCFECKVTTQEHCELTWDYRGNNMALNCMKIHVQILTIYLCIKLKHFLSFKFHKVHVMRKHGYGKAGNILWFVENYRKFIFHWWKNFENLLIFDKVRVINKVVRNFFEPQCR